MDLHPNPNAPLVWQDLDQASLDRAYDQAQWASNIAEVMSRCAARSQALRDSRGLPQRLVYGVGANEQLDFFSCGKAGAPLLVFVHGGAWRSGLAQDYAFVAGPLLAAGVHVAVLDFDAVQNCGGELLTMAAQVRAAVLWLQAQVAQLGADPARLHLAGHSSGAHLAAAVATGDDQTWAALPLCSLTCLSGIYELEPVRRSARSRYVAFSDDSVQRLSPARHAHRLRCPALVAHGTLESPQFQWQAQAWAQALGDADAAVQAFSVPPLNHFEMLESLAQADSPTTHALLALLQG
jgi:arylformamidase